MYHGPLCICVAFCVESVLEVKGEREEKNRKRELVKKKKRIKKNI